jgi:hypothetical protein
LRHFLFLLFSAVSFCCAVTALHANGAADSWISLFDGKSFAHWRDPHHLTPPGDAWIIEDGSIKAIPKPTIDEDLVSANEYVDFELEWDWKISEAGNSGVKYRVQAFPILTSETRKPGAKRFEENVDYALADHSFDRSLIHPGEKAQIYVVGFEYQMIDNARHPDAKRGPLYQTGALYSIVPPSTDATKPVGEWNRSRLVVRGIHFEHWLNGTKVVDVSATPDLLRTALAKRWGAQSETLRLLTEQPQKRCPITLQNHGNAAWFRNIRIRPLA